MPIAAEFANPTMAQLEQMGILIGQKLATAIVGVKVNGTEVAPAEDMTVDITVPTKNSELVNDSSFVPEDDVKMFTCTLLATGWTNTSGVYTQTAECAGLKADYDLEAPQVPSTGVKETDTALKTGLAVLMDAGNFGETLDGQVKWTCYSAPPTVDLILRMRRAKV